MIKYYRGYRKYLKEKSLSKSYNVKFFNFWEEKTENRWFYRFVQSRGLLKSHPKTILSFFSVFGNHNVIDWNKSDVKVFFTGENLQSGFYSSYSDHALHHKSIDLALGFEYLNNDRYLRFPLWILYVFKPDAQEEEIRKRCEELCSPNFNLRSNFAAHISRGDFLGIRRNICENLSNIEKVDCAGNFLHNDDSLWQKYKDDKYEYLKNYKFNICPENSDTNGYVTEKIFQSIEAGCIPVYWGSSNNLESKILNRDAILFWEQKGDNSKTIEFIRELNEKPQLLSDFSMQPRLKNTAAETIIGMFDELERKMNEIIERK